MDRVDTTLPLDKLGTRPGMRVAIIAIDDPTSRPLTVIGLVIPGARGPR